MPGTELVKLYYRIGEVSKIVGVQPHVLRYWETEFRTIRPQKSGKGQRVYSRRDVGKLLQVKDLLRNQGFTIAGARKRLLSKCESGEKPNLNGALEDVPTKLNAAPETAANGPTGSSQPRTAAASYQVPPSQAPAPSHSAHRTPRWEGTQYAQCVPVSTHEPDSSELAPEAARGARTMRRALLQLRQEMLLALESFASEKSERREGSTLGEQSGAGAEGRVDAGPGELLHAGKWSDATEKVHTVRRTVSPDARAPITSS